jgi:hypothetical protein
LRVLDISWSEVKLVVAAFVFQPLVDVVLRVEEVVGAFVQAEKAHEKHDRAAETCPANPGRRPKNWWMEGV